MTSAHTLVSAVDGLERLLRASRRFGTDPAYDAAVRASIAKMVTVVDVGVVVSSLCEVIEYAVPAFDPDVATLLPDLVALPAACLTFERPIPIAERELSFEPLKTLAWHAETETGLHIMSLTADGPDLSWIAQWEKPWSTAAQPDDPRMFGFIRASAAAFTILGQRIVAKRPERLPRTARRHQPPDRSDSIEVYHLRRYGAGRELSDDDGSGREYTHRWWVTGHWMKAAVGPGRRRRRWTWRMGHVKGPQDKPFRPRSRVIVADR